MNKYPIYIISKGRWDTRLTVKTLEECGVDYHIVIEPQEYDDYAKHINKENIFVLPFSNLGQGSIPARNWVWEHSISIGAKKHWILDDNIRHLYRLNHNRRTRFNSVEAFEIVEMFTDKYDNVALSGMNYDKFGGVTPTKMGIPQFYLNTRIYSCILIRNDIPFRWRGRYNEDTDLSLRVLKYGYCTLLINAVLCGKVATMTMKGGNTESLYKLQNDDGRLLMAKSLQKQHPDCVKIVWKWHRWQHQVDYSQFKRNKLHKA